MSERAVYASFNNLLMLQGILFFVEWVALNYVEFI